MNRLREIARGKSRHGSCGIGIGETRSYWLRHGQDAITVGDTTDRPTLLSKLSLLRDRLLLEMQELDQLDPDLAVQLHQAEPARESDDLMSAAESFALTSEFSRLKNQTVLLEGAQGVLLDEWFGFHPHTTWSTVTPRHALELIDEMVFDDVAVLGITRGYTTRHGAGPFPTECPRLTKRVVDRGNPFNRWQGAIRCGPLDLVLLKYAAEVCGIDGLVVNCLDDLPERPAVCRRYENVSELSPPFRLSQQCFFVPMLIHDPAERARVTCASLFSLV